MTRRPLGVARAIAPGWLPWAGAASGALHGLVAVALLWRPLPGAPPQPDDGAALQVEFVSQPAATKGAPANAQTTPMARPNMSLPSALVPSASLPSAPVPPAPPALVGPVPLPAPVPAAPVPAASVSAAPVSAAPAPAASASTPSASAPPAFAPSLSAPSVSALSAQPMVNLGDADEDQDPLTVTGDVVSAGPDPRYRNRPPGYPRAALLLHEEGTVQVLIHVTPEGAVDRVELVGSSGSAALDAAGVAAVEKWRFVPAVRGGVPVASVYPLSMNFRGHE